MAHVVSPEQPDGPEVLLEPMGMPAARTYQKALRTDGVPIASFAVDDLAKEHERPTRRGVQFTMPPTDLGTVKIVVFDAQLDFRLAARPIPQGPARGHLGATREKGRIRRAVTSAARKG